MKYLSILFVSGLFAIVATACIQDDALPADTDTVSSSAAPLSSDEIVILSPAQEAALADVDAAREAFTGCWMNNPDSDCEAEHAAMIAAMTSYENAE